MSLSSFLRWDSAASGSRSILVVEAEDFLFVLAPGGMKGGLSATSRGLGTARWRRFRTSGIFLLFIFKSTLCIRSSSQARVLTSVTPSSVTVLMGRTGIPSVSNWARTSFASSQSSSGVMISTLFRATMIGLLVKSGLMLLNSSICCWMDWPHCSEMSMTYRTAARRCASAVMACISMVLRSTRGWSRIPGVSTTCHRKYLSKQVSVLEYKVQSTVRLSQARNHLMTGHSAT